MQIFTSLLAAISMSTAAWATDITVALTQENIEVDASFAGAHLTLFGVITGLSEIETKATDIVAVVRGPDADFEIRRMQKKNLIWSAGPAILMEGAPALYLTSSTRPLDEIAPAQDRARFGLGAAFASNSATFIPNNDKAAAILMQTGPAILRSAYIKAAQDRGAFRERSNAVNFKKGALFTITQDLPADTPVGLYTVSVYLYRDGALIAQDEAQLSVNKVGIERRIYELAHNQPIAYGIICVLIALSAGWAAAAAFRR